MAGKAIAVAGNIIVDTIKKIDAYPDKLELTAIRSINRALGGLACNVGIALARLDPALPVLVIGFAGDDENGELVRGEFARYPSLDTRFVRRKGITSFTDVMTVESTGERTFFTYKGADSCLTPERVAEAPLEECGILHIGYHLLLDGMDAPDPEYGTCMARALHEAQQRGVETSLDVVSEKGDRFKKLVPPSLPYVDHLAVNEYEASQITSVPLMENGRLLHENLPRALRVLREMGVRKRIVIHTPSLAAGLLYETLRGSPLETAMRTANAVAACSLSEPGSTEGIPSLAEALSLYDKLPLQEILAL